MITIKDIKNAIAHLKEHQTFPATKEELVKTCNDLSDFSKEDKAWFEEHLPEGNYESAQEVMMALGWDSKTKNMEQMPSVTV